jgi:putative phosphoesterase
LRLGIISDTHGLLETSVRSIFAGVKVIVHAGDIGRIEVIELLSEIAPVLAVRGNNDHLRGFPLQLIEEICGQKLLVRHIFGEIHQLGKLEYRLLHRVKPDVVVFGHSHRPYSQVVGTTLLFNPGSAGPKRFSLPRTVGLLHLTKSGVESEIVGL